MPKRKDLRLKNKQLIPSCDDKGYIHTRALHCLNCHKRYTETTTLQHPNMKPEWDDFLLPKMKGTNNPIYLCDNCRKLESDFYGELYEHITEIKEMVRGFRRQLGIDFAEIDGFDDRIKQKIIDLIKELFP